MPTIPLLLLPALAGLPHPLGAPPAQEPHAAGRRAPVADAVPLPAPLARGTTLMLVDAPRARASAARLPHDEEKGEGAAPGAAGEWTIHARLLLDARRLPRAAALAAAGPGWRLADWEGARGFLLVDGPSVAEACALGVALQARFAAAAAQLDARPPLRPRLPNDPLFGQQWHLHNLVNPLFDANLEPSWSSGLYGTGRLIGVVDLGVDVAHPDLAARYDAGASQVGLPSGHGTSVAGLAAAHGDNLLGVAGVAYLADFSSLYFGSPSANASAFSWRNDLHDAKNNAWGPADDGRIHFWTASEEQALADAATLGRGGLGVVFTWAAGNGGRIDRVDYDPYASSRHTIAVGAIDDQDRAAGFNERGASMFCVAPGVGLTTTDSFGAYTSGFTGTSASSPVAAGIVALVLEANPALTVRDVMHVLAGSCRVNDPAHPGWTANSAGRPVHEEYGFGAVDAGAATALAAGWQPVGPEYHHETGVLQVGVAIPDNDPGGVTDFVDVSADIVLEHVELVLDVSHTYVGDLDVRLVAPGGTVSRFAEQRADSTDHYADYRFTSVRHWGESSAGRWRVRVADLDQRVSGTWNHWSLRFYGTRAGAPSPTLTATNVVAGGTAHLEITDGVPDASAWIAYSLQGTGSTWIPGLGVSVSLVNPRPVGPALTTDGLGRTETWSPVPASLAGMPYWLQPVQFGIAGNVVSGTVQ